MTSRTVAVTVAAAIALVATTSAAAKPPQLTPAGKAAFPDRALILTTPKPILLGQKDVRITENGRVITRLAVIPAGAAASRTFGTMLVLDASNSMKGEAIAKAIAAARAFADRRAGAQALGLITFNRRIAVALEPTTDTEEIRAALAAPPVLAKETHLYDAAARAIDVLEREKIAAASVVLLTDGSDTGSETSAEAVAEQAREAGVRVFAVGLRSREFRPAALATLARKTRGTYAEAKSAASLGAIYRTLSEELANEYLLRYQSPAGPDQKVVVEVKAAGVAGVARTTYRTPEISSTPPPPFHRSPFDKILSSPLSALALALFVGLVVALTTRAILRRRDQTVRRRVAAFVKPAEDGAVSTNVHPGEAPERFTTRHFLALDRAFSRLTWWEHFKKDIEIGEFPIQPVPLAVGTTALTLFVAFVLGSAFLPIYALFALAVPFIVRSQVKARLRRRRDKFAEQLPDNLLVLAASMRVGHSFVGALAAVVDEADEPSKSELRRAVADEQLGVPIEDALIGVAERMANGDLEQVALVASLQRETGGNTAAVLDTVVETVRERFELRRMVKTLTAQGRLTRWILIGLPIGVGLAASVLNPYYMRPLFTTTTGQVMLAVVAMMVILGSVIIKRMLEIEL